MSAALCQYHFGSGGVCIRGNDCRFSHSDPPDDQPKQDRICPHYLRGTCKFGEHCRLSHSGILQSQSPLTSNPSDTSEPKAFNPFGPCKFFIQGKCTKGTACSFPHVIPPSTPKETGKFHKDRTKNPGPEPCKFFAQGCCSKGSICPFLHARKTPSPDVATGQIPCNFFRKGICKNGKRCMFGHGLQTSVPPGTQNISAAVNKQATFPAPVDDTEQENEDASDGTLYRNMFSCKVAFGNGASIQNITTSFESRSVLLSNLPSPVTQSELTDLLEPFGHLESIVVDAASNTAHVKFISISHASAVVQGLNNTQFKSRDLLVNMDLKAVESRDAALQSTKVKISWYSPGRVAWAHYNTIFDAKENAQRLDGILFHGQSLSAAFQRPTPRQMTSFSVEIKGLPAEVDLHHLKEVCRAQSVILGELFYNRPGSLRDVQGLLRNYGPLDTFDALPVDNDKANITALAEFADAESATEAVRHLHNKPQEFLHHIPIWLENIHSVKYSIPFLQFEAIKQSLFKLRDDCKDCKVQFYDRDELGRKVEDVCIRVFGTNPKILARVKMDLEVLLRGEQLSDDECQVVWDEFFVTGEGKAFLLETGQRTKTFIKCDPRMRTLRVFGDHSDVSLSAETVRHKIRTLEARRHIINLDKGMIRMLMRGGFKRMERLVGAEKLAIDVVARTLTVHSDDANLEQVRTALTSQAQQPAGDLATGIACPVCYCEIPDKIQLPCDHTYCRDCLRHLLLAAVDSTLPSPKCIYEEGALPCDAPIPNTLIRALLSRDEETRLYEASFLAHIHSRPSEFKYCPTPDCRVVYRPAEAVLRCPSCFDRICASCHVQFHEGLTCSEYRNNLSGGIDDFRKWEEENGVKACLGCHADLQKNGGCNHMHCTQCGTHICWACMKTFGEVDREGLLQPH